MRRFRPLIMLGLLILAVIAAIALARLTAKTVDGIPCNFSEATNYHVHAHLTIIPAGEHPRYPPGGVGIPLVHLCYYWLHTHDGSGIIHIEAPRHIDPTLGDFFDIWGQSLSRQRVWDLTIARGQTVRVYVGKKIYSGNPRNIVLGFHTEVTIELGPPYVPPPPVNFGGL